jgi:putative SOS response-associated peptidase YedK
MAMCARFLTAAQAAAERYWRMVDSLWRYDQSWRVLPTQQVPVLVSVNGERIGQMMRWGLIPYFGPSKFPLINTTAEKLDVWSGWKGPWERRQRCIFSMAGFYEPHLYENGRKEPFFVHLVDRAIFGVAGIWERSRDRDGAEIESCSLITIQPNALMASIHNEKLAMPAILRETDHDAWLNGHASDAKALLTPYPDELMLAWQVSRRLYAVKTPDDASLIDPVPNTR